MMTTNQMNARFANQRRFGNCNQVAFDAGTCWKKQRLYADQNVPHVSLAGSQEAVLKTAISFDDPSPEVKCRILEAILLIAKEPLSARKLATLAGLADPTQARTFARKLNEQYDSKGHAFRIEEIAGGMQLLTRPQFARWLRRLEHVRGEELLSQGMLETLSIVAYRQPLLRAEIEAIRGVNCDEVLRQLMQRDLVRICGRHEDLGRPYLYGTTKRFLQLFGLQSLDSLPRAQKIRMAEAETASRLAEDSSSSQDT
jgi:segregation and condensation protein B